MSDRTTPTRRRLIRTTGVLAVLGLAGCAGTQQTIVGDGGNPPPTATAADDHGHEDDPSHDTEGHEDGGHEDESVGGEAAHDTEAGAHHEPDVHHDEEETHEEGGHGTDGPAEHVEVAMQSTADGEHFHPHVAWVEVGGTVTFVNESGMHSATAYHPANDKPNRTPEAAEPFDSGLLTEEGATFEHAFDVEGVYDLYCAPHEELGMIGSVLVGTPDPHDQPGLVEPQSGMSETVAEKIEDLNHQVNEMLGHTH